MKIRPVFYAFIAFSMITVFSCATGNVSSGSGGEAEQDAPPQKAGAPVKEPAPASKKNAGPLYSGNGGKGTSIAVLTPSGKGLSPDENYLPTLVQGVLAGDFTRYSAMQVIDRQTLDAMIRELLDPVYTEDAEVARLGGIVPAQYILVGELTKAGPSYILNLRIADSKTGAARYSYEGIAARAALDDFSAIRQASEDLLSQMGITLTDTGKEALYGANRRTVEAETALARGVTAQRGGGTVAALNYYSQAADLQTGLTEAEQRLAALTKKIEGGDVGENIRNDIERRNAWIKLLDEAAAFYQENPYYDLVYYTKPEIGNIDYNRNTAEVKFSFWLEPNARYTAVLKIVRALMKTGKAGEWGLEGSAGSLLFTGLGGSRENIGHGYTVVGAELLDEAGDYIADGYGRVHMATPSSPSHYNRDFYFPLPAASGPVGLSIMFGRSAPFSFTVDAGRISGNMRLSGIRILPREEWSRSLLSDFRSSPAFPFTGALRVIPSDKPINEYFKGRRNVKVEGGRVVFTFR